MAWLAFLVKYFKTSSSFGVRCVAHPASLHCSGSEINGEEPYCIWGKRPESPELA